MNCFSPFQQMKIYYTKSENLGFIKPEGQKACRTFPLIKHIETTS